MKSFFSGKKIYSGMFVFHFTGVRLLFTFVITREIGRYEFKEEVLHTNEPSGVLAIKTSEHASYESYSTQIDQIILDNIFP